jgi:hypothetical protein
MTYINNNTIECLNFIVVNKTSKIYNLFTISNCARMEVASTPNNRVIKIYQLSIINDRLSEFYIFAIVLSNFIELM